MSSYDAYEDLIAKSNKGLEFYRKLETNVTKLLQRVKGTCKVQEEEREQILLKNGKQLPSKKLREDAKKDLKNVPSAGSDSSSGGGSGLKLKDYLQNMKKEGGIYTVPNPNNLVPQGSYSPNHPNYGVIQPPPTHSTQTAGYPDSAPGADATQPWVPSVRPAPVGSEGNVPANKLPDLKTDLTQNYAYPASTNYPGYNPQYYYRSSQTNIAYNEAYYNTLKNQQNLPPSDPSTTANNLNYQQPQMTTTNSSSAVPNLQYNPVSYQMYTPGSNYPTNNADVGKYTNQYVPSQSTYGSTAANYQPADYYQNTNVQNYQQGYSTANSTNPQSSISYPASTQGYGSTSASPNHNTVDLNRANQNAAYTQSTTPVSKSLQGYSAVSNASYTTPTTYPNQPGNQYIPQQAGYVYPSQGATSFQYDENYQPSNDSYNWQQAPQLQHQQQPQLSTQQLFQQSQSTSQPTVQQVQQPVPSPSPQLQQASSNHSWVQSNQYPTYTNSPAANTNVPYTGAYSNMYSSVSSSNAVLPASNVTPEVSQYPSHSYYPPSYPQQYQYPSVPGTSHYTHATQQVITSQTNSSQTSIQGQTYASQYNSPTQTSQEPANTINPQTATYYSQQYGYQYSGNGSSNTQVVSPVDQGQVTPMSPMTYMQASNSGMKMTYSQQHPGSSTPVNESSSADKKESSNVDLLAGLDFSVNETPLVPEPSSQDKSLASSVSSTIPNEKTTSKEKSGETKIEEKLASLSMKATIASTPPKQEEPPPMVSF